MPILRSINPAASPQPFSLRDIERQASLILSQAQERASSLLEQAQVEAEHLREAARAAGHAQGLAEGRKQGVEQGGAAGRQQALADHAQELKSLIGALAASAGAIDASRQQLIADGAEAVIALAIEIARKTIFRFAAANPDAVIGHVSEALRLVVGARDVQIRVHPTHRSLLESALPQLQERWPSLGHVTIVGDDSITPGGARISSASGEIDATLDGMIGRIAEQLTGTPSVK